TSPALVPLSLHDALPISTSSTTGRSRRGSATASIPRRYDLFRWIACRLRATASTWPYSRSSLPLLTFEQTDGAVQAFDGRAEVRSEEHTSELQSRVELVC